MKCSQLPRTVRPIVEEIENCRALFDQMGLSLVRRSANKCVDWIPNHTLKGMCPVSILGPMNLTYAWIRSDPTCYVYI